jgi:helicase MOV-10
LIVVGDPTVLSLDPVWRRFMNEVASKGGWRGKRPDWDLEKQVDDVENFIEELRTRNEGFMEETIQRLRSMVLTDLDVIDEDEGLSAYDAVWRTEE